MASVDSSPRALVKKGQYSEAVQETLKTLAEGLSARQEADPSAAPCFVAADLELLRSVIGEFCKVAQLEYAVQLLKVCPMEAYAALGLNELVAELCKQRRFEMASRAVVEFKVIEREAFGVLEEFIRELFAEGRYLLAMNWAKTLQALPEDVNLPENLRLTPSLVVKRIVDACAYDAALKFIKEYGLQADFPVLELINGLVAQGEFRQACNHIKKFGLAKTVEPTPLIEGMLAEGMWSDALSLIRGAQTDFPDLKLSEMYTPTVLLTKMIDFHDWEAVTSYLTTFAFDSKKEEHKEVFVHFVSELITAGELYKAMKYADEYDLGEDFSGEKIINIMIELGQHQHAMYFMKKLDLEDKFKDKMAEIQAHRISTLRSHRRLMQHKQKLMEERKRKQGLESKSVSREELCVLCEVELSKETSIVHSLEDPRDELLRNKSKLGISSAIPNVARSPDASVDANGREEDEEEIVLLAKTNVESSAVESGKPPKQKTKQKATKVRNKPVSKQDQGKGRGKGKNGSASSRRRDKPRGNGGKQGSGRKPRGAPGPMLKNENVQILKRPDNRGFGGVGVPFMPSARPFPMATPMPRPGPGMFVPPMQMPFMPPGVMPPGGMLPGVIPIRPPFPPQPGLAGPAGAAMPVNPNLQPPSHGSHSAQGGDATSKSQSRTTTKSYPNPKIKSRKAPNLKINSEKQFPSLGASSSAGKGSESEQKAKTIEKPKPHKKPKEEKSQATAQFLRPSQIVFKSKKKSSK